MGDLLSASMGYKLTFNVRIELSGDEPPTDEVVENVNEKLREVSDDLEMK